MESIVISSVCWVPRGKAKEHPKSYINADDYIDDYESGKEDGKEQEDHESGITCTSKNKNNNREHQKERKGEAGDLDMHKYDDDDFTPGDQFFSEDLKSLVEGEVHARVDDSEEEENKIHSTDLILLCASAEADTSNLEIYIYDAENESFFVHHDFIIGNYPLCLEWLNECAHPDKKNLVAVGSFEPLIHIWDLDVLNKLDAVVSLGLENQKHSENEKNNNNNLSSFAHQAAVMSLHKNSLQNNLLLSGSADETVKVWDVNKAKCLHTYSHHKGKVQVVRWHSLEGSVILSGSFDNTLAILDVRTSNTAAKVSFSSEIESAIWSRHRPYMTISSTEDGRLLAHDVRKLSTNDDCCLFNFVAHQKAATSVTESTTVENMLVSCSLDETAKVWNLGELNENKELKLVCEKNLKAGSLYTCSSNPDIGYIMAFGGRCPVIWDLNDNENAVRTFNLSSCNSSS